MLFFMIASRARCPRSRTGTTTRPIAAPGLRRRPDRAEGRLLRRRSRRCCSSSRGSRRCGCATTSAARPTTAARPRRTPSAGAQDFRAGVWMQTLLRDPAAGLMHACIYFGFIVLFIATVISEIDHQLPGPLQVPARPAPTRPTRPAPTSRASCSSSASAGRSCAATCSGPYRIRIKTKPEDAVILGTFLVHRRHRLLGRGAAHRARRPAAFEKWSFVGYPLSSLVKDWSLDTLQRRAPLAVGRPRRLVPRVPGDPARPRSSATCSRHR